MPIQVEQAQTGPCRVELTIQVPPEDVTRAAESVYKQALRGTTVPGFRPGKAPRQMLEKLIDSDRVQRIALERVISAAYRTALTQTGIRVLEDAEPSLDIPEDEGFDFAQGFTFKATVSTAPVVELGSEEGMTARRFEVAITDQMIERELDRRREARAEWVPYDGPAELGDRVRMTAAFRLDGALDEELSVLEPTLVQVGANMESLDEGLLGLRAGEEKTIAFTFPQTYDDEALRGETADVTVQCSEVRRRQLPEVDEEFAREFGAETPEQLREEVRTLLQGIADKQADESVESELISELVRRAKVTFPPELLDQEVGDRMNRFISSLEEKGQSLAEFLRKENLPVGALEATFREEASTALATTLVVYEYAAAKSLLVTPKDLEEQIKARAASENVRLSQMRQLLHDSGEINELRHRLLVEKVTRALRESAVITEEVA